MALDVVRRQYLNPAALLRAAPFLVLIVAGAALSYCYHLLLLAQRESVEHTYEVLTVLETTLVCTIDAETGQRGYVITGEEAYLAPYRRALGEIPVLTARLRRLVSDSALQLRRTEALRKALAGKISELNETLAARQIGGMEAARAVVLRDKGRLLMDDVRSIIGEMRRTESELLVQRSAQARRTERWLLAITLICAVLSVIARLGLARLGLARVEAQRW